MSAVTRKKESAARQRHSKHRHIKRPAQTHSAKQNKRHLRHAKRKPSQIEYIYFDTRRYRISFPVIFTVFLIFAGGVGTAFSFAYLQDMRMQVSRTRTNIQLQRDENTAARAVISQNLTVDQIAQIAQERLNMGPVDPSQVVRINVPRQSYVVQSAAPARQEPEGMWQSAFHYIRNWLGV